MYKASLKLVSKESSTKFTIFGVKRIHRPRLYDSNKIDYKLHNLISI